MYMEEDRSYTKVHAGGRGLYKWTWSRAEPTQRYMQEGVASAHAARHARKDMGNHKKGGEEEKKER